MAPPSIAMTSNDEAWLLWLPTPSIANEKVFDQPTEVNNPTATTHHIASRPPVRIAVASKTITISENNIRVRPARDLPNWNSIQQSAKKGRYIDRKSTRLNSSHRCISY